MTSGSDSAAGEHGTDTVVIDVGFYGKLPSHGDFLRRRVSDAFIGVWDGWLQECIAASQATLGPDWLDVYLTSPVWRFACTASAAGPVPVIGVMAPSVDRVGRYFYLTVVAELPPGTAPLTVAVDGAGFFESAERLVLDTLASEQVDFERFDRCVADLGSTLEALVTAATLDDAAGVMLSDDAFGRWQVPIGSPSGLGRIGRELLSQRLATLYEPLVLWWTEGSAVVEPSCLIGRGLPHPDSFAALLDGAWSRDEWQQVQALHAVAAPAPALVDAVDPPRFQSAAASDVGRVRAINQDSFLERTEVGLWAVADGLGGHSAGEVASRMVCDALAGIIPGAGFEEMVDAAREQVLRVNEYLVRVATQEIDPVQSGSTVVALLARGARCAILWAGDSRAYRWRSGRLEQLTEDHSLAALSGGGDSHAVTRAVGGEMTLTLDLVREQVHPGDRFLLCSDGLTRTVSEDEICNWMEHDDIGAAVAGLIRATLEGGAPDNVTALIVEAVAQ